MGQTFKDRIKDIWKKHGIERFFLICYLFILLKVCEDKISVFIINHYPNWLGDVFSIIQSTQWLNWTTLIVIVLTSVSIIICFVKRKESISSFFFCFLVFMLLSYRNRGVWDYLCLPFTQKFDYRDMLDLLLAILIIVELVITIHLFKKELELEKQNDADEDVDVGFVQNTTNGKRDVGWNDYAKSITERIELMKKIKESFAIGISGSWGSGKTTFMGDIKQFLNKDKFTILDFEPWACTDSNQIIKEYFDSLSRYFEQEDKKLAKKLLTYADLVIDINSSSWIAKLAKALKRVNKNSISGVKKQVEDRIKEGNTVVIFIDDLDRLGPDELYETLRLIRVTANFKNVIYIVAYDSLYVEELLTEKGINNGSAFIKKIINVEISLPGYEGHHIPNLLFQELSFMIKDNNRMKLLEKAVLLKYKDNYITSIYLEGFRDVKRFANIFALNFSQILKNKSSETIDFKDFFLIELLHYSYPKTYYALKNNPLLFLIQEYSKNMYVIRKDLTLKAKEEERQKALSEIRLQTNDFSEKSLLLLQLLFDENLWSKTNSIQNIDSFYEYFYYRNLEDKLSLDSFKKAIEANSYDEIENVVNEWCNNNIWLGPSISNRFKTFYTKSLSEQNAKNYLLALIKFSRYITPGGLNNLMASLLKKENFDTSFAHTLSGFLKAEIKNEFPKNGNPLSWPMIFKGLYTATPDDASDGWENDSLLSNDDIEELKKTCFEYWIKNERFRSVFDFKDIFKKGSLIQKYLQASVVLDWYDPAVDERESYVLLGKEYIFQYLKCSDDKEFKSYEDAIFKIAGNMPDDYFYDIDEYGEYNWNRIRGMFANKETYIEFILSCVNGLNEDAIVEHLRKVGISKGEYEKNKEKHLPKQVNESMS